MSLSFQGKEGYRKRIRKVLFQRKVRAETRLQHYITEQMLGEVWKHEAHLGALLKSVFHGLKQGMAVITVEDWEQEGALCTISLDPLKTPQENVQDCFKRARKAKKRWQILPNLIEKTEKELKRLEAWIVELETVSSEEALVVFCNQAKIFDLFPKEAKEIRARKGYREFRTASGLLLLVGRNDRANDQLTFSVAYGNDLWFHAADVPGSHVVLRIQKGNETDIESIQDALQLALYYSKAREGGGANVVMTQCKYIRRTGKKLGQVTLSQYDTHRVILDAQRLKKFSIF